MLPKKVLIIDDERIVRYTAGVLLGKKGVASVQADSGKQGIEMALREKPDLILLDIMMPDMDGWAILERLGANPDTAAIPVVMFSAGDYSETEGRAQGKGLHGILRKPFQVNDLLRACELPET